LLAVAVAALVVAVLLEAVAVAVLVEVMVQPVRLVMVERKLLVVLEVLDMELYLVVSYKAVPV
jgi:hypothetical protein